MDKFRYRVTRTYWKDTEVVIEAGSEDEADSKLDHFLNSSDGHDMFEEVMPQGYDDDWELED